MARLQKQIALQTVTWPGNKLMVRSGYLLQIVEDGRSKAVRQGGGQRAGFGETVIGLAVV
jgi:hypothetical protein